MPGPWRPKNKQSEHKARSKFQSQPRCQAPGDSPPIGGTNQDTMFQSQPRCQAPGDIKPCAIVRGMMICFNLNRDARPLATQAEKAGGQSPCKFQSQPRCQ